MVMTGLFFISTKNIFLKRWSLYLSKEMLELHREDDRYRFSIKKLADMNNTEIEIEIIEREDLVDVQRFDDFTMTLMRYLNQ